ncbi:MAG: extracellular solute-binding protein [Firmicutes bacterium]|nr:extracellular solute-binding protein [Bacillota bacterium]
MQYQNIENYSPKKSKLRVIIAITLAVLHLSVFTGLIACIGVNSRTELGQGRIIFTGELERGARIRVLENDTAIAQGFFSELIAAFNAEYASYNIQAIDANQGNFLDLEQAGPFGFGPCVLFQANDRIMRFAEGGHIFALPIEQLDTFEYVGDKAWNAFFMYAYEIVLDENNRPVMDGEQPLRHRVPSTFGAPVMIQGPVIYYRRSLVDPEVLTTWANIYQFNRDRATANPAHRGYIRSMIDPYFNFGYLLSYGAYIFAENNTDPSRIGLSQNGAERGANVHRQLASSMDNRVVDHSLTPLVYEQLARGIFAATMTTPDVYTLFIDALMRNGFSREEAVAELGVAPMPKLPLCGDLRNPDAELIPSIMMGGINGYAISAYTPYPNAALAFINFATSFRSIQRRHELLGIAPAREDVAEEVGGISLIINEELAEGNIFVMPSIRAMTQVWGPVEAFFADLAQDAFRSRPLLQTQTQQLQRLAQLDTTIYNAIWTFA